MRYKEFNIQIVEKNKTLSGTRPDEEIFRGHPEDVIPEIRDYPCYDIYNCNIYRYDRGDHVIKQWCAWLKYDDGTFMVTWEKDIDTEDEEEEAGPREF